MKGFARALIAWQRRHGRHDLPWQADRDPYRVWLSEIMLQQTQVSAVLPYFARFTARFPRIEALAAAPLEDVLALWAGLGYYARARNLHRAAREIVAGGGFPDRAATLAGLPGIGRSTAAAIAVFAFGRREAILDGNVKRVLARAFGIEGWPGEREVEARLWHLAESLLPERGIEAYTQALMDLGATLCLRARPACERCPLRRDCVAQRGGRTASLPGARPRLARPLRRATWLVGLRSDRVWLTQRPPRGLWGGLWTFPELSRGARAPAGAEAWPAIEHGFTHFRLRARVLLVDSAAFGAPGSGDWFALSRAHALAVPTPVRRLLEALSARKKRRPRRALRSAPRAAHVRGRTRAGAA